MKVFILSRLSAEGILVWLSSWRNIYPHDVFLREWCQPSIARIRRATVGFNQPRHAIVKRLVENVQRLGNRRIDRLKDQNIRSDLPARQQQGRAPKRHADGADPQLRAMLLRDFELDPTKKGRGYSKGNRQKVALVAAFARRAKLYILDEPTSGLDPVMESVFQAQVDRVREEGATVLLSSHILSEVEQLCQRVTIVRAGTTVETGTLSQMRHLTRTSFRVSTPADPLD